MSDIQEKILNEFNGLRAVEVDNPLTCGARYLCQPTLVSHALERIEMLEPVNEGTSLRCTANNLRLLRRM